MRTPTAKRRCSGGGAHTARTCRPTRSHAHGRDRARAASPPTAIPRGTRTGTYCLTMPAASRSRATAPSAAPSAAPATAPAAAPQRLRLHERRDVVVVLRVVVSEELLVQQAALLLLDQVLLLHRVHHVHDLRRRQVLACPCVRARSASMRHTLAHWRAVLPSKKEATRRTASSGISTTVG